MGPRPNTLRNGIRRFWERVVKTETCWLWTGCVERNGYGRLQVNRVRWMPHRLSYFLAHGDIPDGLCVLHSCDNTLCVNPSHLRTGTAADNTADKVSKGRHCQGETVGTSRFTETDIREMRRLRQEENLPYHAIGERYSTDAGTAWQICTRRSWKHVE